MPDPSPGLLDLLSACYENLLCELERGIRFALLVCQFKCGIAAKALNVWVWVENRGPRTANNSLMGNYWSLKQHNLKSCEKTAFTEGKQAAAQWGTTKIPAKQYEKASASAWEHGMPPPIFGQRVVNSWRPRARHWLETQTLYNRTRSQMWWWGTLVREPDHFDFIY